MEAEELIDMPVNRRYKTPVQFQEGELGSKFSNLSGDLGFYRQCPNTYGSNCVSRNGPLWQQRLHIAGQKSLNPATGLPFTESVVVSQMPLIGIFLRNCTGPQRCLPNFPFHKWKMFPLSSSLLHFGSYPHPDTTRPSCTCPHCWKGSNDSQEQLVGWILPHYLFNPSWKWM